jgi:hypothetical protein
VAKIWRLPLHSLLFGIYPVLALIAANLQEAPLEDGLRAIVAGILLTFVLLSVLNLLFKDWHRAGLLTTILLLSFFSYGHVYMGLKTLGDIGLLVARHRFLLPAWAVLTIFLTWFVWKRLSVLEASASALNTVALILLIFPLIQITAFLARDWFAGPATSSTAEGLEATTSDLDAPDIYYIIADAYSRQDLLEKFYDYDNTEFLNQLKELGFYIADCSLSNYPKTRLSLTSSLNMDYLENLGITANDQGDEFWRRIRNSVVRKTLEAEGYQIVSLETGFYWTEWPDADIYLSRREQGLGAIRLNGFETVLLQTTLVRAPLDLLSGQDEQATTTFEGGTPEEHFDITRYALDSLDELAFVDGPKFVFAHLLIPHGPFVFDAEGVFVTEPRSLVESYNAQVTYLNLRLLESLTTIINESERPVVIILQGDHGGPGTQLTYDRMKILNAYYLPEGEQQLYSSITPVNSFRIVFDIYFGTEFGRIEDLSYYSDSDNFFDVTLISEDNPACLNP